MANLIDHPDVTIAIYRARKSTRTIFFFYFLITTHNRKRSGQLYEGESVCNQPIPFPMDRDGHDFMLCFNTSLRGNIIERLSSQSLIKILNVNRGS